MLSRRLLELAAGCTKLSNRLSRTAAGRHVAGQLVRSATSGGAKYQEACGAESRADFVHKLQVALKELRETDYRLRLTEASALLPATELSPLLKELDELTRILVKSVLTAKSRST
jgi:four helix bundle protein